MGGAARTLAGRYALAEVIGRGGMATVYRARDLVLGRLVAVKILSPALVEQEARSEARFEREARVVARLSHPGIVKIFDSGADGEQRFIVMEHVPGISLAALLRERGRLPVAEALDATGQIADALAAIHAAGLVHRDLKPSNAMIDGQGTVKLLDFGIAFAPGMAPLTQTSTILGSAPYMAPEQASGARGDARSDIYSLGCLLYALLEGTPPFAGESAAAVLHQHLHEAPRKLSRTPRLPAGLEALVMQMLAKRPEARPAGAAEIRDRLAAMAPSRDDQRAAATLGAASAAPTATRPAQRTLAQATVRRSSRRLAFPMAGAAAACAGAVALVLAFALNSGGAGHASGSSGGNRSHRDGAAAKAKPGHVGRVSTRASSSPSPKATPTTEEGTAQDAPEASETTETSTVLSTPASDTTTETEAPAGPPAPAPTGPAEPVHTPPTKPAHVPPGHDGTPPAAPDHPVPPGHGGVPPGHGGVPPGHADTPHGHGETSSDWYGGWSQSES